MWVKKQGNYCKIEEKFIKYELKKGNENFLAFFGLRHEHIFQTCVAA